MIAYPSKVDLFGHANLYYLHDYLHVQQKKRENIRNKALMNQN